MGNWGKVRTRIQKMMRSIQKTRVLVRKVHQKAKLASLKVVIDSQSIRKDTFLSSAIGRRLGGIGQTDTGYQLMRFLIAFI